MIKVFRNQDDKGGNPPSDPPQEVKTVEKTGWGSAVKDEIWNVHGEELSKHKDINSVIEDYYSQKEKLSKSINRPGESASEEEVNKFKESMGVPLKVEDYVFGEIPNGAGKDENFDKWFREQSLKRGLTKDQAKEFYNDWKSLEATGIKAQTESKVKAKEETEKAMRVKYGDNYEAAMAKVTRILNFGGDEFKAKLKETGLDNDPGLVQVLAKLGDMISEDTINKPKGGNEPKKLSAAEVMYPEQGK
ncbi:MAG: hypothetical protein E3J23_08675 [Candidatus Stahlbacteria bacterium]|nr:MAG: hypothetical protein E3J23_08675 [Candidatus Stahlbacteria bacterium]